MADYIYYVNGNFVPAAQAGIGLNDLGLVRGYGVFEVLRTYGAVPFGLLEHLERLERSATQIDLPLPGSLAELKDIVHATLAHNDATDVSIRIIVTGGPSNSFMTPEAEPSMLVLIAPVKPIAASYYTEGARLITVDLPRFMPTVKSLNYITAIRGQRRARAAGAVEALYCSPGGEITECTTSNFFIFHGDQLITSETDILPGITRAVALELASDNYEIIKRPIRYAELAAADEAFITSTTKEIMPVVQVDAIPIGSGKPGTRTGHLRALFAAHAQTIAAPA
jgi:branched-chain amino acid aminotransferase